MNQQSSVAPAAGAASQRYNFHARKSFGAELTAVFASKRNTKNTGKPPVVTGVRSDFSLPRYILELVTWCQNAGPYRVGLRGHKSADPSCVASSRELRGNTRLRQSSEPLNTLLFLKFSFYRFCKCGISICGEELGSLRNFEYHPNLCISKTKTCKKRPLGLSVHSKELNPIFAPKCAF